MADNDSCSSLHRIERLENKEETIFSALKKIEDKFDSKLDLILFQIHKVAVLENSHQQHQRDAEKLTEKFEEMKTELQTLRDFKSRTEGAARLAWLLWTSIGISVVGIIVKLAFNAN